MTIYSLDVILFLFGTSLLFHVQFYLLLPDLHTGFSRGRSGGLIFLSQNFPVYCDPHSQRLWHSLSWSKWPPTPVFLPGKSHEQRSLVAYSPWGCTVRNDRATNTQVENGKFRLSRGSWNMALLPSLPTNQKTVTYPAALTPNIAIKTTPRTSLVVQWVRISLPVQGTHL